MIKIERLEKKAAKQNMLTRRVNILLSLMQAPVIDMSAGAIDRDVYTHTLS